MPLEYRFAFSPSDPQVPPDGIILLAGGGVGEIKAVIALSQEYPNARLIFKTSTGSRYLPNSAATRRAFTWNPKHGRLPRTHFTPPRCSNQSAVKGGYWSLQPCICRGLSDAFEWPDFMWSRIL